MGAVLFYTLDEAGGTARWRHACQLTEQAYLAGERVLVWLADERDLARFDDLLWSFGDRAFVPHEPLAADGGRREAPVALYAGAALAVPALPGDFTTLVMLRDGEASGEALRFNKVIEVVDAEPACRTAGRGRFRWYREQGVVPQHFEVKP